jgi:hypothetical protein
MSSSEAPSVPYFQQWILDSLEDQNDRLKQKHESEHFQLTEAQKIERTKLEDADQHELNTLDAEYQKVMETIQKAHEAGRTALKESQQVKYKDIDAKSEAQVKALRVQQ